MLSNEGTPFNDHGFGLIIADLRRLDLASSGGANDFNNDSSSVSQAAPEDRLVQSYDAHSLWGIPITQQLPTQGQVMTYDATTNLWGPGTISVSGYLTSSNNLSDLGNASTARGNLGLGDLSVLNAASLNSNIFQFTQSGYISKTINTITTTLYDGLYLANLESAGSGQVSPSIQFIPCSNVGSNNVKVYSTYSGSTALRINVGNGAHFFDFTDASTMKIDATQVLATRQTGWAAATGTPTRSTFATGAVSLSVLAEHVKALIDDLLTHGLIGT